MLKPMLARGELHMIGATTIDEYRMHIEKGRRFGAALPAAPWWTSRPSRTPYRSCEVSGSVLIEVFHGVKIQDSAMVESVNAESSVHLWTVPAGQGDRLGRRGVRHASNRDRFDAGRAR